MHRFYNDLKQEAIKWVKADMPLIMGASSHKMWERWKERFNITEEDLR